MAGNEQNPLEPIESAIDRTASAANRAASQLAGFAGGSLSTNPQLDVFANSLGAAGKVLNYFSNNLAVLRQLSGFGVDFGMDMSLMTNSLAGAREDINVFMKRVSDSGDSLMMFNGTINEGARYYLDAQKQFYFTVTQAGLEATEASKRLLRLGMTTQEINDTFLSFDAMMNYRRRGEMMTVDQRNQAAAEFTESLIELGRLTGRQADELAAEMAAQLREGDIAAFLPDLREGIRIPFQQSIEMMEEIAPEMRDLTKDILIRGRPLEDMREVYAMMPDTVDALHRARMYLLSGQTEAYQREMDRAAITAARETQNSSTRFLAQQGSATGLTNKMMELVGNSSTGFAEFLRQAADEMGVNARDAQGNAAVMARARELQQAEIERLANRPRDPNDPRTVTETLINAENALGAMAVGIQQDMRDIYTTLGGSAQEFSTWLASNARAASDSAIDFARNTLGVILGNISFSGSDFNEAANTMRNAMGVFQATGMTDEQTEMRELLNTMSELQQNGSPIPQEMQDRANELLALARTASSSHIYNDATVTMNNPVVNPNFLPQPDGNGQSIGTLGNYGRLFKDFGTETLVPLHGVEAVLTPEQVANLVENSARGALSASESLMNSGLQRAAANPAISNALTAITSRTSSLQGMLNTLRSDILQGNQNGSTATTNELVAALQGMSMENLPRQLRQALEEALNGSLKEPIEQLVAISRQSTDFQERTYKNTRGIHKDYLRGA